MGDIREGPGGPAFRGAEARPPPGLDALAEAARVLAPPMPDEKKNVMRVEAARVVDRLLARVSRGRGALEVAMGEAMAALAEGDRTLQLGYSGLGDYARERLGMAPRTAQEKARLARELRSRPLLREAVRCGEVSVKQAQAILPVARGEAEAEWVARARTGSVRALTIAVRDAAGAGRAQLERAEHETVAYEEAAHENAEDEAWVRVCVPFTPAQRAKLDQAMALAGKILGPTAPVWERLQALCEEYLGTHPVDEPAEEIEGFLHWPLGSADGGAGVPADDCSAAAPDVPADRSAAGPEGRDEGASADDRTAAAQTDRTAGAPAVPADRSAGACPPLQSVPSGLAQEIASWAKLEDVEPVPAPNGLSEDVQRDPRRLDAELQRLASLRARWDDVFGHLSMLLCMLGLWREAGFGSLDHYARERLAMGARTVEQRAWLERRLYSLPGLRDAMREGRVSYEKARLVAGCASDFGIQAWMEKAEGLTCIALKREIEGQDTRQMCARRELDLCLPRRIVVLLSLALRAARAAAGTWLPSDEGLERMAEHFTNTWEKALAERSSPHKKVLARDGGLCQVPGCSRAAAHAHHIVHRSQGGGDDLSNMIALCASHHLHGVHRGWIHVRGQAPDALVWKLGARMPG
jgi:hypothetical protein